MRSALQIKLEVDRDRTTTAEPHAPARVSSLDSSYDCVVDDLSSVGAEILTSGQFELNQRVDLDVPPVGTIPGRVTWCRGRHIGVQFMAPLDETCLAKLSHPPPREEGCSSDKKPGLARADLEARLVSLICQLSDEDLEMALDEIAELSSHRGR